MCWRSKCKTTASDVPQDESNYQHGAGAFLGNMRHSWDYEHVKDVTKDRSKVLQRLPWMEGASYSYCSTLFGGSGSESQKSILEGKYNMEGISLHLTWSKLICFTYYFCLFTEISCFCYLCYIFYLTWIITFGWPQVVDSHATYVINFLLWLKLVFGL